MEGDEITIKDDLVVLWGVEFKYNLKNKEHDEHISMTNFSGDEEEIFMEKHMISKNEALYIADFFLRFASGEYKNNEEKMI